MEPTDREIENLTDQEIMSQLFDSDNPKDWGYSASELMAYILETEKSDALAERAAGAANVAEFERQMQQASGRLFL